MNTANIKKYAPLARNAFITAVSKRANELGIYHDRIEPATEEGQTLKIEGRSVALNLKAARNKLIQRVESTGFNALMEHIAYTWFNRLCAIRYMELHDYLDHGFRVLSSGEGRGGSGEWGMPEILEHAQDVAEDLGLNRDQIIELKLAGNQDELLYRTLLLGQCHALHQAMPFLFESIDDETEILLLNNLIRTDSILRGLVDDIPAEDWQQVEVIGWLYQFYISEKKDQVIGKVVKSVDIPAATQLFTPNWIVKYLVQNSVGRQWLQTYPDSSLKAQMEYYIEPAEQTEAVGVALAANTPDSIDPEKLKILDSACGSGHILVEAYHTLKAIYEERGYRNREIPQLILENNLFGLDIDDRAAQLSGFALMMLARANDRRIFSRDVQLNVMSLRGSTEWLADSQQQWYDLNLTGKLQQGENQDLFSNDVIDHPNYALITQTLALFEQAKTFGSLIQVPEERGADLNALLRQLKSLVNEGESTKQKNAAQKLLPYIQQACLLVQKYDAVVANPPYMGGKGMNPELKAFAKKHFPDSKSDLFAMFMQHGFSLLKENGFNAQVTMQSWMFLSSYEKMRETLLNNYTIETMTHMGNGVMKIAFGTNATVFRNVHMGEYKGFYSYVENDDVNEQGIPNQFPVQNERLKVASADDFKKIPASPIAYWVSSSFSALFSQKKVGQISDFCGGMNKTANNDNYLRLWFEINYKEVGEKKRWVPYFKGGKYRKFYGNQEWVVDWSPIAVDFYKTNPTSNLLDSKYWFREGITYSDITSSGFSCRYMPSGFVYDMAGPSFHYEHSINGLVAALNISMVSFAVQILNPTLHCQVKDMKSIPIQFYFENKEFYDVSGDKLISLSKTDWNTYEISWDFQSNHLINTVGWVSDSVTQQSEAENAGLRDKATIPTDIKPASSPRSSVGMQSESNESTACIPTEDGGNEGILNLANIYTQWQRKNRATIAEMQDLEQENNRLFIDAYGLQDELTPDVPLEQITLTVNPKYRKP